MKNALSKTRECLYLEKPQHGAFVRLLNDSDIDLKMSMSWLRKCYLDPYTESYICGAQELALFTKYHEKHILKNSDDDRCRICKKDPETIFHIFGYSLSQLWYDGKSPYFLIFFISLNYDVFIYFFMFHWLYFYVCIYVWVCIYHVPRDA